MIKPCPYCGKEPDRVKASFSGGPLKCIKMHCGIIAMHVDEDQSEKEWNVRVADSIRNDNGLILDEFKRKKR